MPTFMLYIGSEAKPMEGKSLHQRCSSESFLLEQPSWLDDLLNDTETVAHKGHRRSSSDSSTYVGSVAKLFDSVGGTSWGSQSLVHDMDPWHKKPTSSDKQHNNASDSSFNTVTCSSTPKESEELSTTAAAKDSGFESLESSTETTNGPQIKNSVSKAETKRVKQQSAHRSRIRKLQYIANLESNIQALQADVCGFSTEIDFLDKHNTIMSMENQMLKQRLDNLSQEHVLKTLEMEILLREIVRLQTLHQIQHQQQIQNNSGELDVQFSGLSLKN